MQSPRLGGRESTLCQESWRHGGLRAEGGKATGLLATRPTEISHCRPPRSHPKGGWHFNVLLAHGGPRSTLPQCWAPGPGVPTYLRPGAVPAAEVSGQPGAPAPGDAAGSPEGPGPAWTRPPSGPSCPHGAGTVLPPRPFCGRLHARGDVLSAGRGALPPRPHAALAT